MNILSIPRVKKLIPLSFLIGIPVFIAGSLSTSFQDLPFYYDFFGIRLAELGIVYLLVGVFVKKWRRPLLLAGGLLFLVGVLFFICFYGYTFNEMDMEGVEGGSYFDQLIFGFL